MHAYLKSLEVSNFKGFSAYFARMSPLGVYTYTFGFHSDNLTPFWTVSGVSIGLSTRRSTHAEDFRMGDFLLFTKAKFHVIMCIPH